MAKEDDRNELVFNVVTGDTRAKMKRLSEGAGIRAIKEESPSENTA